MATAYSKTDESPENKEHLEFFKTMVPLIAAFKIVVDKRKSRATKAKSNEKKDATTIIYRA